MDEAYDMEIVDEKKDLSKSGYQQSWNLVKVHK